MEANERLERIGYQSLVRAALAMALVAASGIAMGQRLNDPANLAGERVRATAPGLAIPGGSSTAALKESLLKLRTRASLMLIVAHPDDEDGGMLSYESLGEGARVATLTLTRGEGGQNLASGDFDGALGLIRTQELLAADRYMGVDQMFGTEVDFGFSKTKEETLAKWTHERVLYDAVCAVRLYRPLVVVSEFIGGPTDGHGHHQVSGEIAQEVFTAAADPKVFPEMGLEPWAPLKVYARVPFAYVTSQGIYDYATNKFVPLRFYNYVTKTWSNELPKANVLVHEGDLNAQSGMSYAQLAREALALQKTQINMDPRRDSSGPVDVGYHRYGSRVKTTEMERSFFDGIDVSLEGIATLSPSDKGTLFVSLKTIDQQAAAATAEFSSQDTGKCAPALRLGLKALDDLIAKVEASPLPAAEKTNVLHELRIKRVQFNDALVKALGLHLEARMEAEKSGECSTVVAPGCTGRIVTRLVNEGKTAVEVNTSFVSATGTNQEPEKLSGFDSVKLNPGKSLDSFFEWKEGGDSIEPKLPAVTRPYFTQKNSRQAYYDVSDPALRLAPATPAESLWVHLSYDGVPVEMGQVVLAPTGAYGNIDHPLDVVPSLSLSISPSSGVIPPSAKSLPVSVNIHSEEQQGIAGKVHLELPQGWRSDPRNAEFAFHHANETQHFSFLVTPDKPEQQGYTITAIAETPQGTTQDGYKAVGYPGLIPTNMYAAATYKAQGADVKVAPGLKVGYLPGTGDTVQASLESIGIHATTLTIDDIKADRLAQYDVVLLGVRAYAAHPDLARANEHLLAYAKAGGVLIVQYNRGHFDYGPYPYSLGHQENVVDETAPVKILQPNSPVFSWPNRITEQDFDGWIEERGHSFMESWDPHYDALLETHDPRQDPQKGGLLVAKTGKGVYVYVAFALYRQLQDGVPGAYRLLANLLSLGKAPSMQ